MVSKFNWPSPTYLYLNWPKCHLHVMFIQKSKPKDTLHMLSKIWTVPCNARVPLPLGRCTLLPKQQFCSSRCQRPSAPVPRLLHCQNPQLSTKMQQYPSTHPYLVIGYLCIINSLTYLPQNLIIIPNKSSTLHILIITYHALLLGSNSGCYIISPRSDFNPIKI